MSITQEVSVRVSCGVDFVPTDAVAERAAYAGLDDDTTEALAESYAAAQLLALKAGLLAALGLAAGALAFTRHAALGATEAGPAHRPGGRGAGRPRRRGVTPGSASSTSPRST